MNNNRYSRTLNGNQGSKLEIITEALARHQHNFRLNDETGKTFEGLLVSTESSDQSQYAHQLESFAEKTVRDAVSGFTTELSTLSHNRVLLSDKQVLQLEEVVLAGANLKAYLAEGTKVVPDAVYPGNEAAVPLLDLELSKESFEQHGMANTMMMTLSYNISAERQTPAVELFFPTISLGATQNNYTLDVPLTTVYVNRERDITGKGDLFRKQMNIIKGLRYESILRSGFTDLIPVFRAGQNDKFFVDSTLLAPTSGVTEEGESYLTNYLVFDESCDLLGLSQTNRDVSKGAADATDQIAANPSLMSLALKVGNDTLLFENLQYSSESQFTHTPKGDREDIMLQYRSTTHLVSPESKATKTGQLPTELQALADKNLEALLTFDISGKGNTDYGWVNLKAGKVKVSAIRDFKTKELKPLESDEYADLVKALEATQLVGFKVDATLTNSNMREHGMILDTRQQRVIYGVRLHGPISVVRPVDDTSEQSDAQRVDALVKASYIRRSNAGVTAIYDLLSMLKTMPQNLDTTEMFSYTAMGVAQYFSRAYVRDLKLDALATVQSLQTVEKLRNVGALLTNKMLTEATQAFCSSELAAAYESCNFGKPHVIAIADTFTRRFIFRESDERTLGDGFDFSIEECSDIRLINGKTDGESGTIFMSFGVPKSGSSDSTVPLWFGNCLDKREVPRIVNRARGSKYQHEVMVQPWFTHIIHLPVLIRIVVENLKAAADSLTPFNVKEIKD